MREIVTTCALDCPDNCGMIAVVKEGRVTSLKGNPGHGYTRGYLCRKGYNYPKRVYSTDRVLYPQKRTGDGWKRIGWEEALDTIAGKITHFRQACGDSSIMHYQRSSSWGTTKHLVKRFFNLLGDVTTQTGSLCAGSVMAAQKADLGARLGNDPADFGNSKAIVIWGRDPWKSSIHVVPILMEARKKGAAIIVVDPVRTKTASKADVHLSLRPGSDGYLSIGVAKELLRLGLADDVFTGYHTTGYDTYLSLIDGFSLNEIAERCDLSTGVITRVAELYGRAKPASIYLGYGINKWVHSPEMIRLIDALGALTGNIGISGGGVNHGFLTRRYFDAKVLNPVPRKGTRVIPEPLLARGILEADPPVRMMWINGTNPVASCPDSTSVVKALKSLEFLVVVDHFMTDTADLADIFLPAATFLEEDDIVVSWGHNWIGPVNRAIEPPGEARSDLSIVQELAKRLGLEKEMEGTAVQWLEKALAPMEKAGITVEQVMRGPVKDPLAPMVAFEDRQFPTPSGKFEFPGRLHEEVEKKRAFHLLTVLGGRWLNSLILREEHPHCPPVAIHPDVAKSIGVQERSKVLLRSDAGELIAEAHVTDETRRDTLVMAQGSWIKRGGGVNRLTEPLMSTSGEMAGYYTTTVDIEPARS